MRLAVFQRGGERVLLDEQALGVGENDVRIHLGRPSRHVGGDGVGHRLRQRNRPVRRLGLERCEPDSTARQASDLLVDANGASEKIDPPRPKTEQLARPQTCSCRRLGPARRTEARLRRPARGPAPSRAPRASTPGSRSPKRWTSAWTSLGFTAAIGRWPSDGYTWSRRWVSMDTAVPGR